LNKAKKKSIKRINISVDPEISAEWKDWAESLGASVSELVRKSMKFVKNNIGDIAKLEQLGPNLEKIGDKIEIAVKEPSNEDLGRQIENQFKREMREEFPYKSTQKDKERIKKRVRGLVKLHNSIPIEKLANILNISTEYAENIIYELLAEDVEGTIEDNEFKFINDQEEDISKLLELLDKIL
jgi:hypothetical protein